MITKKNEGSLMFLERDRVMPVLEHIKNNENPEKRATVQIQVNLKGYNQKKDNKISRDVVFPHEVRRASKVIVLADKARIQECRDGDIPHVGIEELIGEEKKSRRVRIFKQNRFFILCTGYNSVYQLKDILKAGNTPYVVKSGDKLADVFRTARKSFKVRIKDFNVTSFPVGHTGMETEHIYDNIKEGLNSIISYLKDGLQNLKGVFIKTNQTKPITLY